MDSLLGYGSDSGGEEQEAQVPAPKKGLLGSLPVVKSGGGLGGLPPAKKQRRTLEIGKMMKTPTKGSDSDDDTPAIVSKAKASSGLLSFVSLASSQVTNCTDMAD